MALRSPRTLVAAVALAAALLISSLPVAAQTTPTVTIAANSDYGLACATKTTAGAGWQIDVDDLYGSCDLKITVVNNTGSAKILSFVWRQDGTHDNGVSNTDGGILGRTGFRFQRTVTNVKVKGVLDSDTTSARGTTSPLYDAAASGESTTSAPHSATFPTGTSGVEVAVVLNTPSAAWASLRGTNSSREDSYKLDIHSGETPGTNTLIVSREVRVFLTPTPPPPPEPTYANPCDWLRRNGPRRADYTADIFGTAAAALSAFQRDNALWSAEVASECAPPPVRRFATRGALLVHPAPPVLESLLVDSDDYFTAPTKPARPAVLEGNRPSPQYEPRPGGCSGSWFESESAGWSCLGNRTVLNQDDINAWDSAWRSYTDAMNQYHLDYAAASIAAANAAQAEVDARKARNEAKMRAFNGTRQNDGTYTGGTIATHLAALNAAIATHWPNCRFVAERLPNGTVVQHRPPASDTCRG